MTIREYLDANKDNNLALCILNIRNLNNLSKSDVYLLHDFLWNKQRAIARNFEY
jgi:hypothetical protein